MGLIKGIVSVVGLLILAVVGLGAFLYFTDYEAQGTITQKGSDSQGTYIVITPDAVPYDVTQRLDGQAANFVCEGYKVTYKVQSQHYRVLDQQSRLVYDSKTGLNDAFTPVRCSSIL